jgi:hypothetical protein
MYVIFTDMNITMINTYIVEPYISIDYQVCDYQKGFGLANRFIDDSQVVTTNNYNLKSYNYNTIADFHTFTDRSTLSVLTRLSLVFAW